MKPPAKFVALIFLCACFPVSAWSQISYTADLERLKADHQKSLQAAADPINRRYGTDLDNLLRKATQSGDLDTALKVKEEIKAFGLSAPPTASDSSTANARDAIVGKWHYKSTDPGWEDTREFKIDGSVQSVTAGGGQEKGKWLLQGNKVVVHWPRRIETIQLPAVDGVFKGVVDHAQGDAKKSAEFTLTRIGS